MFQSHVCYFCGSRTIQVVVPPDFNLEPEGTVTCKDCGKIEIIQGIILIDESFRVLIWCSIYGHGMHYPEFYEESSWHQIKHPNGFAWIMYTLDRAMEVIKAFRSGVHSAEWEAWCKAHPRSDY